MQNHLNALHNITTASKPVSRNVPRGKSNTFPKKLVVAVQAGNINQWGLNDYTNNTFQSILSLSLSLFIYLQIENEKARDRQTDRCFSFINSREREEGYVLAKRPVESQPVLSGVDRADCAGVECMKSKRKMTECLMITKVLILVILLASSQVFC